MKYLLITAALIGLTGCMSTAEDRARAADAEARGAAELSERLAGLSPSGDVRSCIPRSTIREVKPVGNKMVFQRVRDQIYVNDVTPGCERSLDDVLVFQSSNGSSYCSGDIVTLRARSSGMVSGSCSLGEFTLYER